MVYVKRNSLFYSEIIGCVLIPKREGFSCGICDSTMNSIHNIHETRIRALYEWFELSGKSFYSLHLWHYSSIIKWTRSLIKYVFITSFSLSAAWTVAFDKYNKDDALVTDTGIYIYIYIYIYTWCVSTYIYTHVYIYTRAHTHTQHLVGWTLPIHNITSKVCSAFECERGISILRTRSLINIMLAVWDPVV